MSLDDVLRQLAEAERKVRDGVNEGLYLGGEHVLGESNAHTPIEEGPLERSGKVTQDPDQFKVAVSYNTPYAVRQHEDLTYAHDPGRTAKFLENAFNAEAATVAQIVVTSVRRKLGT